jgi:phenylacetate-CoA ligase
LLRELETAFIREAVHPLWAWRDHPQYRKYREQFERNQYLKPAELRELQRQQVHALLRHANAHCAFYRERFAAAGLKEADFQDLSCLKAIPPLTKLDIQQNFGGLTADNVPKTERVKNQTGGSTGSPLQFYVDKERFDSRMASTSRHNEWAGYRHGDWCAYLWGARLDMMTEDTLWNRLRNRLVYRRIELNTSSISEQDWERFIEEVRRLRPRVMLAYAQSAVLFGERVRNGALDIGFDSIITTAEVLLPEQRAELEATFGGKVFNRYGCRELSIIASECNQHEGLHVNADALFLELAEDPAAPEASGKIVITDMLNRSMPLIRYEIGDVGRWGAEGCSCGRTMPLLADVQGRITDFLTLKDGRKISGPSLTLVVADMPDVQQVQFVQKGLEAIVLRVVPGRGYSDATRAELRRRLELYLQGVAVMDIEETTTIQSERSGKYRFVANEMEQKHS